MHILRELAGSSGLLSLRVNPAELDFDPLRIRSLHHQVQAFILKATYEGSLGPGDRLNESTISAQLGISRTPVREALTYLEGSGLVVRVPRRGFFLASLSEEDAAHCYVMRELLEGYAARLVAGRLKPAQVAGLEQIVEAMGRAVDASNWPQAAVQNIAFHETVIATVGNPVLLRMWRSVGPVLWYFDSLTRQDAPTAREGFVERHRTLVAALRTGHPDAAEAAFIEHIDSVKRVVIARLRSQTPSRGGTDDE
jgi:DNA-binding GntR family transcriptional regulator